MEDATSSEGKLHNEVMHGDNNSSEDKRPPRTVTGTALSFLGLTGFVLVAWPLSLPVILLFIAPLFLGWLALAGTSAMLATILRSARAPAPTAKRVRLPDGRHVAWAEQGVSKEQARHCIVMLHGGPDSRLTGIPGISHRLLEEFGVRVVSYDRPGYGQSDSLRAGTLRSAAADLEALASALDLPDKLWVLGYSGGGPYGWAAARYIPHRLAGVAQWAPDGALWWPSISPKQRRAMWRSMPTVAWLRYLSTRWALRLCPPWLASCLVPAPLVRWAALLLTRPALMRWSLSYTGPQDRAKLADPRVLAALQESVREALRQGDLRAVYEDLAVPAMPWGFDLADLQDFPGPIHVWQGTDDRDVPLALTRHVKRVIPSAHLHVLEGEGHYSKFVADEDFHRTFLTTLFGPPGGRRQQ